MAVITVAMAVGALAKSVTGMGLPLMGVPVMASVFGAQRAVLVMALPTFVTNCWLLWEHRAAASQTRHLPPMLALGVAGTVAGTVALTRTNPAWLALALGLLLCAYIVFRLARPQFRFRAATIRVTAPGVGFVGGLLQGATGLSGPLLAPYMHSFGLSREAFVFSITAAFQFFALVQITTFALLGSYTTERVVESLLSLVPVLLVFPLGIRLAGRIDTRRFEQAVLALLGVMGVKLLIDGLGGL